MTATGVVEKKIGGVNRTVLAGKLGMDRSYLSQMLNGKRDPGLSVARKVAREVGVTVEQLAVYLEKKSMAMEAVN
jgi:transcriptional regulator with XRE-family HTH domain